MRTYINPEMKITKFDGENVTATATELPTINPMSVIPNLGSNVQNAINNAQQSVQANVDFQDAIKFR